MTQRIVVNGVQYDSVEAMPADVRQQYERAMAALQQLPESSEKNVQSVPGAVKINVTTRKVLYNVDGKTYTDPSELPPEIRAKLDNALHAANVDLRDEGRTDVRVLDVHIEQPKRGGSKVLLWVAFAAIAILAVALLR